MGCIDTQNGRYSVKSGYETLCDVGTRNDTYSIKSCGMYRYTERHI
jgi:hypothetical protein